MKTVGLLLMPAGFFLLLAALVLFPAPPLRGIFAACGLAVELLGFGVAIRGHLEQRRGEEISSGRKEAGR